jgi:cytochrome c-type biogenesis protein CcmI
VLVTVIGLVIVLLAAFFVAWPLLQDVSVGSNAAADSREGSPEHEKEQALRAIREADFDHQVGKLSDEDHAALRAELESRALAAMAAIESASALHPVAAAVPGAPAAGATAAPAARGAAGPAGFCPACGVRFVRDAGFCSGCGKKLTAATQRGRRRA